MEYFRNPKIIGSFMIGFAIVAGAYVVSNFGEPRTNSLTMIKSATADEAPMRVFIPTSDNDSDGVEDWRDRFVVAPAVTISETSPDAYKAPKTLTGQLGVSLIEGLLATKAAGPIVNTKEQLLEETIERLEDVAIADIIYDYKDIIINKDVSNEAIRTYGNAIANIILTQSKPELEHEIILLRDFLEPPKGKTKDPSDLIKLATVYKNYLDKTLETPVPKIFIKEHLDLINVYNALYVNIDTMSRALEDPILPYVRLKRYEDDVQGLGLSLKNVHAAIFPYAKVFEMNDPAILLTEFSGEMQ